MLSCKNSQKHLLVSLLWRTLGWEGRLGFSPVLHLKEGNPRKPGTGESVGKLSQSQVSQAQYQDDLGSWNRYGSEKHRESQRGGWCHILQFQSWARLGLGHVHGTSTSCPHPCVPECGLWILDYFFFFLPETTVRNIFEISWGALLHCQTEPQSREDEAKKPVREDLTAWGNSSCASVQFMGCWSVSCSEPQLS